MNLFSRYNRISLLTTIAIFILAITSFTLLIRSIIINQLDEDLEIRQKEITSYAATHSRLPDIIEVGDQLIQYSISPTPVNKEVYTTVELFDSVEKVRNNFRQLQFGLKLNDQWYQISVAKSMEGAHMMFRSLLLITIITIFLILLTSWLLNRIVLKKLWKPFYSILNSIKNFKLGTNEKLIIPTSDITEFKLMSDTIANSTNKAILDYNILKEFTENASHEMQTPLAVIRSKIDLLTQDEHLTEQQSLVLQSCYNAIQRLNNLNRSLLLLAKIENRQFSNTVIIDLKKKVEDKIEEFRELWQVENIRIEVELTDAIIQMNSELADILLNNLLSNATRYNQENGEIHINLNATSLKISNSSSIHPLDDQKIFSRFYKAEINNQYTGLGLSIVKQICDLYGFTITYTYQNTLHQFTVMFIN